MAVCILIDEIPQDVTCHTLYNHIRNVVGICYQRGYNYGNMEPVAWLPQT